MPPNPPHDTALDQTLVPDKAPDAPELQPVDRAQYVIEREIARGGMGRILLARDRRLGRPVAIKEMLVGSPQLRRRFEREARMTARLQHPSIVNVYEAGRWPSGELFFAMKMVKGRSLEQAIADAETLDERLALLPHVVRVAEALAYAHEQGVIHRDLKSANVLVGAFGETVVIDWGLAKDVLSGADGDDPLPARAPSDAPGTDQLTVAGSVMGTPAFMPPEQARGETVDARADVYAIGAILYHALAGETAYTGSSSIDVLRKLLEAAPTPLEQRQPGAPREVLAIVAKAMARDPQDRYPSAKELAEDLERFQHGQLVAAYRYGPIALLSRWLRKYRVAVSILAAAVAGLIAITSLRSAARERAIAAVRADELALANARALVHRDPRAALDAVLGISTGFGGWGAARMVAADALTRGIPTVLRGHEDRVDHVAFSPDGRLLASSSGDATVRVWELATGQSRIMRGHQGVIGDLAFSPDGKWLATAGWDRTARLWNVETGESRVLLGHRGAVLDVAFSPDGKQLASASGDHDIRLWSLQTGGSHILSGHTAEVRRVAFLSNTQLVSIGDYHIGLWQTEGGPPVMKGGHTTPPTGLAVSADHTTFATSAGGTVLLWRVGGGDPVKILDVPGERQLLAFSPDGKRLALAGDNGAVRMCEVATQAVHVLGAHESEVLDLAFSPDGQTLATAGRDGTLRLWGKSGHTVLRGHDRSVSAVAFAPTGGRLASGGADHTVRLWSPTAHMRELPGHQEGQGKAGFLADGRLVAAGAQGAVRVWDARAEQSTALAGGGKSLQALTWTREWVAAADAAGTLRIWDLQSNALGKTIKVDLIKGLTASPDGKRLGAVDVRNGVRVWDVASGQRVPLADSDGDAADVAFSPDGAKVASGFGDGQVRVWNLSTGNLERSVKAHEHAPLRVVFAPDGAHLASAGSDGVLAWTELASGSVRPLGRHSGAASEIAFSADGHLLASGGEDSDIHLHDLTTNAVRILRGHEARVNLLVFSPDGATLASASDDSTARLWDVRTGESRALVGHGGRVSSVAFSPDGSVLATASSDGSVRLWGDDLPHDPAQLVARLRELAPP